MARLHVGGPGDCFNSLRMAKQYAYVCMYICRSTTEAYVVKAMMVQLIPELSNNNGTPHSHLNSFQYDHLLLFTCSRKPSTKRIVPHDLRCESLTNSHQIAFQTNFVRKLDLDCSGSGQPLKDGYMEGIRFS